MTIVFTTNRKVALKLADDMKASVNIKEKKGFATAEQKVNSLTLVEVAFPNHDQNKWSHPLDQIWLRPGDKVAIRHDVLQPLLTNVSEVDGVKFVIVDEVHVQYVVRAPDEATTAPVCEPVA